MKNKKKVPIKKYKPPRPLDFTGVADIIEESTLACEIIHSTIVEIINRGGKLLLEHHVQEFADENAAELAVEHSVEAVEFLCLANHGGDGSLEETWELEEEPGCTPIDRFARGAIRLRQRGESRGDQGYVHTGEAGNRASIIIPDSIDVSDGPISPNPISSLSRFKTTTKKKKPQAKTPKPIVIEKTDADLERDLLREEGIVRMEKLKKLERDKVQKEQERAEEEAKMKEIQKKLAGQDYTFDNEGNVVVINAPNPGRMPAMDTSPTVTLNQGREDGGASHDPKKHVKTQKPSSKKKKKTSGKKRKGSAKKRKKKAASPKNKETFVRVDANNSADAMVLVGGVTLKMVGGHGQKAGPSRKVAEPRNMTRDEYMKFIADNHGEPKKMSTMTPVPPSSSPPDDELHSGRDSARDRKSVV